MKELGDPVIKELVLDVLKQHAPSLPKFASLVCELECVDMVDITQVEMNEQTESLKMVLNGNSLDFEELKNYMGKQGAVIHSVDQVVVKNNEE